MNKWEIIKKEGLRKFNLGRRDPPYFAN